MNPSIAILGSARSDGNTAKALQRLTTGLPCELIDLNREPIAPFSYAQDYPMDDAFAELIERILVAPVTILATPVYWYSYSTPMKRLIDRFTDLLFAQRALGRRLRGCRFAFLSTGNSPVPTAPLNAAYHSFCSYLGLEDLGAVYASEEGPLQEDDTVQRIRAAMGEGPVC